MDIIYLLFKNFVKLTDNSNKIKDIIIKFTIYNSSKNRAKLYL